MDILLLKEIYNHKNNPTIKMIIKRMAEHVSSNAVNRALLVIYIKISTLKFHGVNKNYIVKTTPVKIFYKILTGFFHF